MDSTDKTIRLGVSRHLQDFNGYCGPACALMVVEFTGSAKSPPVFAQNEFFREIRTNAKANKDRRPVKSPAESLLTMLNDHTAGEMQWTKIFNPDSFPVAKEIFLAVEEKQQPCLMLVSKGMHWVVAFGVQRMDDGRPAGYILRDPAWAGMPKFYGLSVFPETPAIEHTLSPCPCLSHTDNPPGSVHERYITVGEMLSHRGLQGSPDWEGKGAIAIVPDNSVVAAVVPDSTLPELALAAPASGTVENPLEKAGAAALLAVKENGLYGRQDSPTEWNKALTGATAGAPILVKDPKNSDDDFYLVPLNPADPSAKKGAWAMLDAKTLELREVSLMENWKTPALPDTNSDDAQKASEQQHTLPDGSKARFKKEDFKPNTNNLVWAASAACVLPYWPVKELVVPHPVTGQPVSIYVTQEGEVHSQLVPDNIDPPAQSTPPEPPKNENPPQSKPPAQTPPSPSKFPKVLNVILGATSVGLLASTAYFASSDDNDDDKLRDQITELQDQDQDSSKEIEDLGEQLGDAKKKIDSLLDDSSDKMKSLRDTMDDLIKDLLDKDKIIADQKDIIEDKNGIIKKDKGDLKDKDKIIADQKYLINKHVNTNNDKDRIIKKAKDDLKNKDKIIANQKALLDKAEKESKQRIASHNKEKSELQNKINEWQRKYTLLNNEKNLLKKRYDPLAKRANDLNSMVNRLNKEVQKFKAASDVATKKYNNLNARYQAHLKHHHTKPDLDPKALSDLHTKLLKQWKALDAQIRGARKGTDTRKLQIQKNAIEKQMRDIKNQLNNLKR